MLFRSGTASLPTRLPGACDTCSIWDSACARVCVRAHVCVCVCVYVHTGVPRHVQAEVIRANNVKRIKRITDRDESDQQNKRYLFFYPRSALRDRLEGRITGSPGRDLLHKAWPSRKL